MHLELAEPTAPVRLELAEPTAPLHLELAEATAPMQSVSAEPPAPGRLASVVAESDHGSKSVARRQRRAQAKGGSSHRSGASVRSDAESSVASGLTEHTGSESTKISMSVSEMQRMMADVATAAIAQALQAAGVNNANAASPPVGSTNNSGAGGRDEEGVNTVESFVESVGDTVPGVDVNAGDAVSVGEVGAGVNNVVSTGISGSIGGIAPGGRGGGVNNVESSVELRDEAVSTPVGTAVVTDVAGGVANNDGVDPTDDADARRSPSAGRDRRRLTASIGFEAAGSVEALAALHGEI